MSDDEHKVDTGLLDLYKLAVEMADRVSARRSAANAFFLTVQTALVGVLGLAGLSQDAAPWWRNIAVTAPGFLLCVFWWLQLRSYRDLNRAKFIVINKLEQDLPRQLFIDEWAALKKDSGSSLRGRNVEIGTLERVIPWIFAGVYALLFVGRTFG